MNDVAKCRHCRTPLEPGQAFCTRCGAATRSTPIGDDPLLAKLEAVFGAELNFEREIGRGGMGAVFTAFDPALQRRVAVKVLLPEIEEHYMLAERFLREARIAAALQHPHIVSVYSVRSGEGVHAIVMQFVEGRGLDSVLAQTRLLPLSAVAKILADVAGALQHAHDRRVIHRDVKPANVLLGYDGRAMVTDFGIARSIGATRITEEGLVMGTLPYISPEASVGGETTPASDQYSLGVMAFELFMGTRPFTGSAQELLYAHANLEPPSISRTRPDLPQSVAVVVHRMLAKDPAERWPALGEIERVFRALVPDPDSVTREMARLSNTKAITPSVVRTIARGSGRPAVNNTAVPPTQPALHAEPVTRNQVSTRAAQRRILPVMALAGFAVAATLGGLTWRSMRNRGAVTPEVPASAAPEVAGNANSQTTPRITNTPRDTRISQSPPSVESPQRGTAPPAVELPPPARTDTTQSADVTQRENTRRDSATADRSTTRGTDDATRKPANDAPARPRVPAALADARRVANAFVTLINKRQWRDLESLMPTGGDATARATIVRTVRGTADVSAGFERVASSPELTDDGFDTECIVQIDVTTGGKVQSALYTVTIRAAHDGTAWHLAGWRVTGAP